MNYDLVSRGFLKVRCRSDKPSCIPDSQDNQVRIPFFGDFEDLLRRLTRSNNGFRPAPRLGRRRDDLVQLMECI